ncbi:MAG: hypothetical protein WC683_07825 [bacterium]
MALKETRNRVETLALSVPLDRDERSRLDKACGPGRPMKRGAWVREAILAALDREEAAKNRINRPGIRMHSPRLTVPDEREGEKR